MWIEDKIIALVNNHYDLQVKVKSLPGYDEWNYLLTSKEGDRYILKVADSKHAPGLLYAQAAVTTYLVEQGMSGLFSEYLLNREGEAITSVASSNERKYHIRVMKYLPGIFLTEVPTSPTLLKSLGAFIGKMDKLLKGFDHCGAHRTYEWDIQHVLNMRKYLWDIPSHENRRIVAYFLLQFEMNVRPELPSLRHSVIHNDLNDSNILVNEDHICGLIDWGDMVYAPLINNLAIALVYVMLDSDTPLPDAETIIRGYHEIHNLTKKEVALLYYLMAARLCLTVIQAARKRASGSNNTHHFISEEPAWKLLHWLIRTNPVKVHNAFRKACGMPALYHENDDHKALLSKRKEFIGKNLSMSYRTPLKIVRGALQYLYDDQGNTYLDCVNNVSHVGHSHPTVVKALQRQMATLNTNTRYLHDYIEEYAQLLCSTLPPRLKVCYFTNSGSEANDLAIRMARHYTGQKDIIVLDHAYHGASTLAIEMSPYKFDGPGGFPQPSFIHKAENPDGYRGKFRYEDLQAGEKYAESVQQIIKDIAKKDKKPAAFICETLLGVGGQHPLPDGYLKAVYDHVRQAGGVCIADEVQVGFGRVGSTFWGFQLQQAHPDIVVMGKPMGNGHPLAAIAVTREIADAFDNGMEYFNTYGGNPVSMAAGKAVMEVIINEELQNNAFQIGNYLLGELKKLQEKHEIIGDVRGSGLFLGAELVKDRETREPAPKVLAEVIERMKERGFLLSADGPSHNVLKIKPPIIFSKQNADELVGNLDVVLSGLE